MSILTTSKKIQDVIETDLQLIAINIYEPDKTHVLALLDEILCQDKERRLYRVSLAENLQKPVYDYDRTLINWQKSETIPQPQGGNPINYYLDQFRDFKDEGIFILEDWQTYLAPQNPNIMTLSLIKEIAQKRESDRGYCKKIILLGQDIKLHPQILRQIPIFSIPLPSQKAITNELTDFLKGHYKRKITKDNITRLAIAANGLTFYEITLILQQFRQRNRTYNFEKLNQAILERKYEILKSLGIEFLDNQDFPSVGGHDKFKDWLKEVEIKRESGHLYGLTPPRGCLLAGSPGCGKTLLAKHIAKLWNVPLLILNISSLKGSLVGESEQNLKRALEIIDYQNAVVLIDEIEKSVNMGSGDNTGVSSGMLGILLFWLNEQQNNFVVATANKVKQIPQELLRAGRLDRRWFVGLPNQLERREILKIHLTRCDRTKLTEQEIDELIGFVDSDCEGFSGSEIEALVIDSLTKALVQGNPQKPTLANFREALADIKVLSKSFPEQHQEVLEWAKNADSTSTIK